MICQLQLQGRTRKPTPAVQGRKEEQGINSSLIPITSPLTRGCKTTAHIWCVLESRFPRVHRDVSSACQPYEVGHTVTPSYRGGHRNRQVTQLAKNHAVPRMTGTQELQLRVSVSNCSTGSPALWAEHGQRTTKRPAGTGKVRWGRPRGDLESQTLRFK